MPTRQELSHLYSSFAHTHGSCKSPSTRIIGLCLNFIFRGIPVVSSIQSANTAWQANPLLSGRVGWSTALIALYGCCILIPHIEFPPARQRLNLKSPIHDELV